ncbi:molybdopterin converting factor subunit 1 [Sphingomonas sp. LaA6.9]|uniref:molybdopterin converting factor subunit 1 n=1 Tax=Sphingomonas sp. LaA6.9 TaxID=2919914 RepID=UPI001F4FA77A|nr:molybdopterin converting factor subunit 1 [Sphingomonas sp. LaA6.9]MCJ8157118.1 molybdopterin converting factor subunit 1 [Sphingomonas sp. LaA6.9]
MAVQLLYFAWVREAVGRDGESVDLPETIATVADLVGWLAARGDGYAQAFADPARLRAAVDQSFVQLDASVTGAREIALFPPVTGG